MLTLLLLLANGGEPRAVMDVMIVAGVGSAQVMTPTDPKSRFPPIVVDPTDEFKLATS